MSQYVPDFELLVKVKELEMKCAMQELHIKMLETQIERFDSNLRLSIQTPAGQGGRCVPQQVQYVFQSKLFETIQLNIDSFSQERVNGLLASSPPSIHAVVKIVNIALDGPHTRGKLIKLNSTMGATYCSYLGDTGETQMDNINIVFSRIFAMVYDKCKEITAVVSDSLENSESYMEEEHTRFKCMYDNSMLLQEQKSRTRILKELMPLIK